MKMGRLLRAARDIGERLFIWLATVALVVGCSSTPVAPTPDRTSAITTTAQATGMARPATRLFTDASLGIAFTLPAEWEISDARRGSDASFHFRDRTGARHDVLRFTIVSSDNATLAQVMDGVRGGAWGPHIISTQPMRLGELDTVRINLAPGDDRPPVVWFVACPSGLVIDFTPLGDPALAESVLTTLRAMPVREETPTPVARIVTPTPNVAGSPTETLAVAIPADWKTYTSPTRHVTLRYPPGWQLVPSEYGEEELIGGDGFLELDAWRDTGSPVDKLCDDKATEHRQPLYGTRPQIEKLQVQGQAACLLWPSDDQPASMKSRAELVALYPQPFKLTGGYYASFLHLAADKNHIREIIGTLKFTAPEAKELLSPAALVVEEYPIVASGVYTPDRLEYTHLISPTILAHRQAWRGYDAPKRADIVNQTLTKFGYRLEPKTDFYAFYQGDKLVQSGLIGFGPVTANDRGDDLALLMWNTGEYFLARRKGIERWDGARHAYTGPVYAGDDLVSVELDSQWKWLTVRRGTKSSVTFAVPMTWTDNPVKGLWSWNGLWVLEVMGRVDVEGQSLNEQLGYDEIFNWQLLNGQPFYFFKKDNRIGVSYAGKVLPYQYDDVIHYRCCEPALFNVGGNEMMVWFHALRDGVWYYVEMGVYR